ncbi:MAG: hypothetical protein L0Y67_07215 [Gammaproteobacteria bacterium]|nr:hypothetical protein [Gammaproteobacteria bacterium]MCI0591374.1 hypothetical protein [Gammaproteobacteria bacterium]
MARISLSLCLSATLFANTVFGLIGALTTHIMLPLKGTLIALFAGRHLSRAASLNELGLGQDLAYLIWRIRVRSITPVALIFVFLNVLGVLHRSP